MRDWLRSRFELSGGPSRIMPMEGLRGVAATVVFLVHYATPLAGPDDGSTTRWLAVQLQDWGNVGVDVFFLLSGYLIYGSLIERAQPFVPFIQRRIERIFPTYLVVWAVTVVVFWSDAMGGHSPLVNVVRVLLNVTLVVGLLPVEPQLGVSWTLSYELLFYCSIPWIISRWGLRERERSRRIRFFVPALVVLGVGRTGMFVAGIVTYEWMRSHEDWIAAHRRRVDLAGWVALVGGTVLAFLIGSRGPLGLAPRGLVLVLSVPVVVVAAFGADGWLARVLSVRPLRWVGNMSYSYYLSHAVVIRLVFDHVLGPEGRDDATAPLYWARLVPVFALTLVVAAVLFVAVEYPLSVGRRVTLPWISRYRTMAAHNRAVLDSRRTGPS